MTNFPSFLRGIGNPFRWVCQLPIPLSAPASITFHCDGACGRGVHVRPDRNRGVRRHRGQARRGAGAHQLGRARVCRRRPARQGGGREPRARAQRAARRRPRASLQAHHRQPRARRPAEGRQPLRPADRARHDGGDGRHRARRHRGLCRHRRAGARRLDPRRAGRAARGDRRQRHGQGPDLPGTPAAPRPPGRARIWPCWRRRTCSRSSITSTACRRCRPPSPTSRRMPRRCPTSAT